MMAEHTPGPWTAEIEDHKGSTDWYAAAIGVGSPFQGNYRTVARVCGAEHAYDEAEVAKAEADARLIAAAPEMLVALESILRAFTDAEAGRIGIERADAWQAKAGIPPWLKRIALPAIRKAVGSGCQSCGESHGVSVPCGYRREAQP